MPSFEKIYGKKFTDMDTGEKELVIVSSLERIETQLERLNGKTKSIPRVEKLTWAGAVVMPLILGWLAWLTKSFFGR